MKYCIEFISHYALEPLDPLLPYLRRQCLELNLLSIDGLTEINIKHTGKADMAWLEDCIINQVEISLEKLSKMLEAK